MPFRMPLQVDDGTAPGAAEPVPRLLSPLLLLTLLVGLASTFLLYRNAILTDQERFFRPGEGLIDQHDLGTEAEVRRRRERTDALAGPRASRLTQSGNSANMRQPTRRLRS